MSLRAVVTGCGSYLPQDVMTNHDLAELVETSDEWIRERTGIRERHIADDGERTSDLAVAAARAALADAGRTPADIDLIIVATTTPDLTFPATAAIVQAKLDAPAGTAFDIQAVCTGFIYALATAEKFLRSGQHRCALVIGAETFSRILDWKDRATCVLFGDGAGAVVLRATDEEDRPGRRAVLSTHLHSDGRHHDLLYVDGGVSSTQTAGTVKMAGREVFRHAVENLSAVVDEALAANGLGMADVDWIVPHQANKRILDATARKLGVGAEKVVVTVDRHANTSAASIPLALAEAAGDGRIRPGHLVVVEAIGGGLAWGSGVIRW